MRIPVRMAFLTSHLQPFMLAGIDALLQQGQVKVLLVHWPPPDDAPLHLVPRTGLEVLEKTSTNKPAIGQKISAFRPDLIYGPGWMDRDYLGWIRACRRAGAITLMGMDNQWRGTLKQHLLTVLSPWTLRRSYTHAFVPGTRQRIYARRLGFGDAHILQGLYTPDTALFSAFYEAAIVQKRQAYPKQLLYLGRLVAHKAGHLLTAFSQLTEAERQGWRLLAVGNGPLAAMPCFKTPHMRHLPYTGQQQLGAIIARCGAGCLTSSDEPWGTAIQEMGVAGLPLIASKQCGASTDFVIPDLNGFLCDGSNIADVREALLRMIRLSDEQLLAMAEHSHTIGLKTTPQQWAASLLQLLAL